MRTVAIIAKPSGHECIELVLFQDHAPLVFPETEVEAEEEGKDTDDPVFPEDRGADSVGNTVTDPPA